MPVLDPTLDCRAGRSGANSFATSGGLVPVSVALRGRDGGATAEVGDDLAFTLRASEGGGDKPHVLAPVPIQNATRGKDQNGLGVGGDVMFTLDQGSQHGVATPFDTTQITSAANYSNPQPGDPCHPLAAGAHPPAIAFAQNTRDEVRVLGGDGAIAGALMAEPGMKQQTYIAFHASQDPDVSGEVAHPLGAQTNGMTNGAATYGLSTFTTPKFGHDISPTMTQPSPSGGGQPPAVAQGMAVRRLTPVECERLQGFQWLCSPSLPGAWQDEAGRWWSPDYTAIPWRKKPAEACPDGPRYKALGNSWAVPCAAWIGARIDAQLRAAQSLEAAA